MNVPKLTPTETQMRTASHPRRFKSLLKIPPPHAGKNLARWGGVLLLVGTAGLVAGAIYLAITTGFQPEALGREISEPSLPIYIYAVSTIGTFGIIASLVAIMVYGFRERWFWWCLVIGSVAWLVFPPYHTIVGLISLLMLIYLRRSFPKILPAKSPAP